MVAPRRYQAGRLLRRIRNPLHPEIRAIFGHGGNLGSGLRKQGESIKELGTMAGAGRTHQSRRMERRGSYVDQPSAGSSHIRRLVDITTIAAHLDVSVRHVRRLVAERRIPYVKWGNLLRFDPVAVADWLGRKAIAPADARMFHQRRSG